MKKLLVVLVFMAFVVSPVFAIKPFVEPYGGAGMYTMKEGEGANERKSGGLEYGIGARAGIMYDMFFGGVDLSYLMGSFKIKEAMGLEGDDLDDALELLNLENKKLSTTHMALGIVAGVELPMIPLRFWGGYNLINSLKLKKKEGTISEEGDMERKGSAIKFGAGFKVIPMLSVNLEYIMNTFNKGKEAGEWVDMDDKVKMNTIFVSASVPFSF